MPSLPDYVFGFTCLTREYVSLSPSALESQVWSHVLRGRMWAIVSADQAVYQARFGGRDQTIVFSPTIEAEPRIH